MSTVLGVPCATISLGWAAFPLEAQGESVPASVSLSLSQGHLWCDLGPARLISQTSVCRPASPWNAVLGRWSRSTCMTPAGISVPGHAGPVQLAQSQALELFLLRSPHSPSAHSYLLSRPSVQNWTTLGLPSPLPSSGQVLQTPYPMHSPGLQCLWLPPSGILSCRPPPLPASGTVLPRCFQSHPEACAPVVPSAESSLLASVCTVLFLSLSFPFLFDGTFSGLPSAFESASPALPLSIFPEHLYLADGVVSSFVVCAPCFLRAFLPSMYLWTPLGLPCPPAPPVPPLPVSPLCLPRTET